MNLTGTLLVKIALAIYLINSSILIIVNLTILLELLLKFIFSLFINRLIEFRTKIVVPNKVLAFRLSIRLITLENLLIINLLLTLVINKLELI